jgi:thiol-disulfide isomerase/thioredoxin
MSIVAGLLLPVLVAAQPGSIITGRLLGSDGKPMVMSHVHLSGGSGYTEYTHSLADPNFASVQVRPDGSFEISTDSLGAMTLQFSGVAYEWLRVPLVLERPTKLSVQVRLAPLAFRENLRDATIIYDFDDVARGKRSTFKQTGKGIFKVTLPTSKKEFKYRLEGVGYHPWGASVQNCTADAYEYLGDGVYTSIVYPKHGSVTVSLDDSRARLPVLPPRLLFSDSLCVQARFIQFYRSCEREVEKYEGAHQDFIEDGGRESDFSYDWNPFRAKIAEDRLRVHDTLLLDELAIEYLEAAMRTRRGFDPTYCGTLLSTVSPRSFAWVYHGAAALQAKRYHPAGEGYVQEILAEHPSFSFRAYLVFRLCSYAKHENRRLEYAKLFSSLTDEYRQTQAGREAVSSLREYSSSEVGTILSPFVFTSLDDSTRTYRNEDFYGKYLLMDFWATWCGPCVAEMPYLHDAYKRYHAQNLEILSVSFDPYTSVVKYFRSAKWGMPWYNAYVKPTDQPTVGLAFNVNFPKPMLIAPNGKILEVGDALRSKNLDSTLSKYLRK